MLIALPLLLASFLQAGDPVAPDVITACVAESSGLTRIVSAPSKCIKLLEKVVQFNEEGPVGPQGLAGPQGSAGAQGPAGPQGAAGAKGPVGPSGAQGATGAPGPTGPKGDTGAQGPIGPKGETGSRGAAGLQGATGPAGPTGKQGPAGVAGPTGPTGSPGAAGQDGDQVWTANWSFTAPATGRDYIAGAIGIGSYLASSTDQIRHLALPLPAGCTPTGFTVTEYGAIGLSAIYAPVGFPVSLLAIPPSTEPGSAINVTQCYVFQYGASTCSGTDSSQLFPAGTLLYLEVRNNPMAVDLNGAGVQTRFVCKKPAAQ